MWDSSEKKGVKADLIECKPGQYNHFTLCIPDSFYENVTVGDYL